MSGVLFMAGFRVGCFAVYLWRSRGFLAFPEKNTFYQDPRISSRGGCFQAHRSDRIRRAPKQQHSPCKPEGGNPAILAFVAAVEQPPGKLKRLI